MIEFEQTQHVCQKLCDNNINNIVIFDIRAISILVHQSSLPYNLIFDADFRVQLNKMIYIE